MKSKDQISAEVVEAMRAARQKIGDTKESYCLYSSYLLSILVEVMVDIRDILDRDILK